MSITILVFILDYFQEKPTRQNFSKNPKSYFGPILGLFCPNLGKNKFFWKKRLRQFFNIRIIYHSAKNQLWLVISKKTVGWIQQKRVIEFISSRDTANFRFLRLIEKSHNLLAQEHFGPYLRNQNFPKYEICSSIQQLQ